jgi:hypothetical protein
MTFFTNFAALVTSPYAATLLVASAAADLLTHTLLFHTPGYTGGYKCFDPAILRDRLLRVRPRMGLYNYDPG